jgi:hypothetical protein
VSDIHFGPVADIVNRKFDPLGIVSLAGETLTLNAEPHFVAETVYVGISVRTSPDTTKTINNRFADSVISITTTVVSI